METGNQHLHVYRGVRWRVVRKYGARALQFLISTVLTRVLVPDDFGLLGMASYSPGAHCWHV